MPTEPDPTPPMTPLAYATPEPRARPSTREVVFACFTLATGVGYSLGAIGITAVGVGLVLTRPPPLLVVLLPIPIFIACVLAIAGYGVIGASWRIIGAGEANAGRMRNSLQIRREIRVAVPLVAFAQLASGTAVFIAALLNLADTLTTGGAADSMTMVLAGAFAVFTGVLIMRLKL